MERFRVATWNTEWATYRSRRGMEVQAAIVSLAADVIILTEGDESLFPSGGHLIDAGRNWGYPSIDARRRKVLMWSRSPWSSVSVFGDANLPPGRAVGGSTLTPVGVVSFVGVCVPWRDAHVRTGRGDAAAWEEHGRFLDHFGSVVARMERPLVVAGDFNQRIPRVRQPMSVYEKLMGSLSGLVVEHRDIEGAPLIDHVVHSADLRCVDLSVISDRGPRGERLSDHRGIVADISAVPGSES